MLEVTLTAESEQNQFGRTAQAPTDRNSSQVPGNPLAIAEPKARTRPPGREDRRLHQWREQPVGCGGPNISKKEIELTEEE